MRRKRKNEAFTHGRKIERDEAPKVLAPPPTANLAEWNFVLKVVVSD